MQDNKTIYIAVVIALIGLYMVVSQKAKREEAERQLSAEIEATQ